VEESNPSTQKTEEEDLEFKAILDLSQKKIQIINFFLFLFGLFVIPPYSNNSH
jgi:hypothetical protein